MKKEYLKPQVERIELLEKFGVLIGDSGEVDPGEDSYGKENSLTWNDDVNDLWGDNPGEEQ